MIKAQAKMNRAEGKDRFSTFNILFLFFLSLSLCVAAVNLRAQTNATYQIEKAVVASGGAASAGGTYALESTAGQPLAGGFLHGPGFSEYSGFWTPVFAPTAANVTIGGRVLTPHGQGIRSARLMLTGPDGSIRFSSTGSFGFYRFNDIPVGATYVLTVFSKRFAFTNPTRVVTVHDQLENLDFVADF